MINDIASRTNLLAMNATTGCPRGRSWPPLRGAACVGR
jgi:hypothetical protein